MRHDPVMKRLIYLIIISLGLIISLAGCTPETISGAQLAEANQIYEAGQFAEAAAAYQAIVDTGIEDGILYYNMGNAYFKTGDIGRAILNYRRAQRLLPRDSDVTDNLELARTQAQDRLDFKTNNGLVGSIRRLLVEWTTLNEAATIALVLWVVLCGLVIAIIITHRGRESRLLRYTIGVTGFMLVLALLAIGLRVLDVHGRAPAVIVAANIEVRSGPGSDYLTEFTLHAGAEIYVVEQRGDWARISLPGDLQGWVPNETVEEL